MVVNFGLLVLNACSCATGVCVSRESRLRTFREPIEAETVFLHGRVAGVPGSTGHLDSAAKAATVAKVSLSPRPGKVEGLVAAMGLEAAWSYSCESNTQHRRSILANRSFAEGLRKETYGRARLSHLGARLATDPENKGHGDLRRCRGFVRIQTRTLELEPPFQLTKPLSTRKRRGCSSCKPNEWVGRMGTA